MKKSIYLIAIFLFALVSNAQDTNQNYTKAVSYKQPTATSISNPDITNANVQVTYYDGLGRPVQQIAHKQSNTGKDIITHMEYDQYGRQTKEYLPYVNSSPSLSYSSSAQTDLLTFYSSPSLYTTGNPNFEATGNPYSQKEFESSPLNRVFKQAAPGDAWALTSGKEIKFDYQTNISGEVRLITATATWNSILNLYDISINSNGNYSPNELYKTITKDENWTSGKNNTTEEFKNKEGQVVLKRTYNNEVKHDTYYVYDQYGNLTYVIPPVAALIDIWTETQLKDLCYQYKYDNRNRLVEKKLPGKQWEFIVYNNQNMPVATGPAYNPWGATGESDSGWLITKYDAFGRAVYTGYYTGKAVNSTTRNKYQEEQNPIVFNETIDNGYSFDGIVIGYTNKVSPISDYKVLSINYYDDYDFPYAPSTIPTQIEGDDVMMDVRSMSVANWTRILDSPSNVQGDISYTLYDKKYRPISTYTSNYLGGFTQVNSSLDWSGKTLYTVTTHQYDNSSTPITITDTFEYSPQDKLTLHKQQINSEQEQLIASNTYDELGQLISKNVGGNNVTGSTGLQKVDFSYNIRGWLKTINEVDDIITENDLFAFKIAYNDPSSGVALFNGNISETNWITNSDGVERKYNYSYDNLNRLLNANYSKPGNPLTPDNYSEALTYDENGNILTLVRYGDRDTDGAVGVNLIDELEYTYSNKSNKLVKVFDSSSNPQGFNDDSDGITDSGNDYTYDENGNMISDDNKGITSITYNHLNLPVEIQFGSNGKITYLYNSAGQKITKHVEDFISTDDNVTTYMSGGFQYKNSELQFFPHAEGYVNTALVEVTCMTCRPASVSYTRSYDYVFNYTDHLGNIRLSYGIDPSTGNIKIIEENHYYPFGLKHTNYNSDVLLYSKSSSGTGKLKPTPVAVEPSYKYKFNGFELQDELGLNWYDYQARNYDPALGRWMNIDPLAETSRRYSPYTYCLNNPIYYIDPDGMQADDWIKNKKTGSFEWRKEVTSSSNTPEGYSYVGKDNNSIVTNLFGTNNVKDNSRDIGVISAEDFDNPYSAKGYSLNNATTNTTLSVSVSADVSTTYNKDGSVESKEFKGVNVGASVSGDVVAPYPGVDMKLRGDSMTMQGKEMKVHQTAPNGEIRQGGDVPTLTYDGYINSSSIQSNFGKSTNINFSFEGQYMNGNSPLGIMSPLGLFISNSTSVDTSLKLTNK